MKFTLRGEISEFRSEMRNEIDNLRSVMHSANDNLHSKMRAEMQTQLATMQWRFLIGVSVIVGIFGTIVTLAGGRCSLDAPDILPPRFAASPETAKS